MSWAWLAAAIVAELGGTLSLRASDGYRLRAWLAPVVTCYAVSIAFLALALNGGMPVGVAYGVWTATGIALVALLARAIWSDPLTARMIAGIAIIAVGVVLVETG